MAADSSNGDPSSFERVSKQRPNQDDSFSSSDELDRLPIRHHSHLDDESGTYSVVPAYSIVTSTSNRTSSSSSSSPQKTAPKNGTETRTQVTPPAPTPAAMNLFRDINVFQPDPTQESYFVVLPKQTLFVIRGPHASRLNQEEHYKSIMGFINMNAMHKEIHARQALWICIPQGQIDIALAAVLEFVLLKAEREEKLNAIILMSRTQMKKQQQQQMASPATTNSGRALVSSNQTRLESALPAAAPSMDKQLPAIAGGLVRRTVRFESEAFHQLTPTSDGDRSNSADVSTAKDPKIKRRIHASQVRERRAEAMANNVKSGATFQQLPVQKRQRMANYMHQRMGGRFQQPMSVVDPRPYNQSVYYQGSDVDEASYSSSESDAEDSNPTSSDGSSSSSYSGSEESDSDNDDMMRNGDASSLYHRPRRRKHYHGDAEHHRSNTPPRTIKDLLLERWRFLFNLDSSEELLPWLMDQLSCWIKASPVLCAYFCRTDTYPGGPSLASLHQELHSPSKALATTPMPSATPIGAITATVIANPHLSASSSGSVAQPLVETRHDVGNDTNDILTLNSLDELESGAL